MVYNDMVYRPEMLSERLRAKFGDRTAKVFRADIIKDRENGVPAGEVISFFGRSDAVRADRPMPKAAHSSHAESSARRNSASRREMSAADVNAIRRKRAAESRAASPSARPVTVQNGTAFARAYAAGESVRRTAAKYSNVPKRRYAAGAVPSGALRRGRSNIQGSRHCVLVTSEEARESRTLLERVSSVTATMFTSRRIAEHRTKRTPVPFATCALLAICTIMVMVVVYSFSQIHEYSSLINDYKDQQKALAREATDLEIALEERDDIRSIEKLATENIGMVSSDVVQSKYVSVASPDRVEIAEDDDGDNGGFSSLLSIIGEKLGFIGDYFG